MSMSKNTERNKNALKVNKGIEQPSSVNPYLRKKRPAVNKDIPVEEYVREIKKGNIVYLSKAITLAESALPAHREKANKILEGCFDAAGNSIRIGITGVPGVGKSTFIEALGLHIVEQKHKMAVLAIDPSSRISGGSILGDKTRMEKLAGRPDVFIRPTASTGVLGGVARNTKESILLCEAAGFDVIIVETVGVGQSEIEVKNMVDFFVLLLLPGAGDELQGIKRGIMEVADAFVINKADGENEKKADLAQRQILNALQLFPPKENHWKPVVLKASALYNKGVAQLWSVVQEYEKQMKKTGFFQQNRLQQEQYAFYETLKIRILEMIYQKPEIKKLLTQLEEEIRQGKISSLTAVEKILRLL